MKPVKFKNRLNGEIVICEDTKDVKEIEGVEYLVVHRPDNQRQFLMRKEALERVKDKIPV